MARGPLVYPVAALSNITRRYTVKAFSRTIVLFASLVPALNDEVSQLNDAFLFILLHLNIHDKDRKLDFDIFSNFSQTPHGIVCVLISALV